MHLGPGRVSCAVRVVNDNPVWMLTRAPAAHRRSNAPALGRGIESRLGVLVCGTGLGMSMAANRHPGIRAALCHDHFTASASRRHNDANVLVMGGRVIGPDLAKEIVDTWLDTPFEGGRHLARVERIDK